MSTYTPRDGAFNLLKRCAYAKEGDRLLIACEAPDIGYYGAGIVGCVHDVAISLGLGVDVVDVGFNPDKPHLSHELLSRFEQADIILFLARLGDQLRFSDMPKGKRIIVSYAVNLSQFGSAFAAVNYEAFKAIKTAINRALDESEVVHLTCPAGSDVVGSPEMNLTESGDTSIIRFPLLVHAPVPAHTFSGRIAMPGFLTGTGSRYYEPYTVCFSGPVFAVMADGRLSGFEGAPQDVAIANGHYDKVAEAFGIDRDFVHSWHAGMHPGSSYPWPAAENYERWSGAAFGNPRLMHFHTCGAFAPGEISWNIVDPTIVIDDVAVWDSGVLHLDRLPGGPEILESFPDARAAFTNPAREIGL